MKKFFRFFLLFVFVSALSFAHGQKNSEQHKAKYVFLFIGDGMGIAQVNAAEAYLSAIEGGRGFSQLSMTKFPFSGFVNTYANNRLITGSAASGTALASGNKTNINRISMDPEGNNPYKSIAEKAKEVKMKVGIISNVSIDHATPAVFYAHQPLRSMYFEIGHDLVNSNFDLFGGGGFKMPVDTLGGKVINLYDAAVENGFNFVNTRSGFDSLENKNDKIFIVSPKLDANAAMLFTIDMSPDDLTLADITEKAIKVLDNKKGFFIMVEGGKIDWASHNNDAATVIHEVIAFDKAIGKAVDFYLDHPDETLIVITADHETGGMALGNENTEYGSYLDLLKYQRVSYDKFYRTLEELKPVLTGDRDQDFETVMEIVRNDFGLGHIKKINLDYYEIQYLRQSFNEAFDTNLVIISEYGDYNAFNIAVLNLMNKKAGIGWVSGAHTGINVPVFAIGVGAEKFTGRIDNTDIPKIIEGLIK